MYCTTFQLPVTVTAKTTPSSRVLSTSGPVWFSSIWHSHAHCVVPHYVTGPHRSGRAYTAQYVHTLMVEFMPAWEYVRQQSVCPSMRAHMQADVSGQWCITVVALHVSAHPKLFEFLCGQARECASVSVVCMYVDSVAGPQGSAAYCT